MQTYKEMNDRLTKLVNELNDINQLIQEEIDVDDGYTDLDELDDEILELGNDQNKLLTQINDAISSGKSQSKTDGLKRKKKAKEDKQSLLRLIRAREELKSEIDEIQDWFSKKSGRGTSELDEDSPAPGNPTPGNPTPGNPTPGNPTPGNNFPVRSGLQVYRDLLNEVQEIKGTKAIAVHDFFDKFNFFGLNKIIAFGIRKATKRKTEIDRIVRLLDEMDPNDFELLIDDFLLKDGDIRGIVEYKVNEILLMAVEKKCEKDYIQAENTLSKKELEYRNEYDRIQTEINSGGDKKKIAQLERNLAYLENKIRAYNNRRRQMEARSREVRRGRKAKSYDRKNNIKGGLKANRNPDNREEINKLADIELKALRAEKEKDLVTRNRAWQEMEDYKAVSTKYELNRRGNIKASLGAFEAARGDVKVISDQRNIKPEVIGGILQVIATLGVAHFISDAMNQQAMQQGLNSSDLQIDNSTIQTAQNSLQPDAANVHALGERGASLSTGFDHSVPDYAKLDQIAVQRTNNVVNGIQGFTPTGNNNFEKLGDIFAAKQNIAKEQADALSKVGEAAQQFYHNGNHTISTLGIDHHVTSALEENAAATASANYELYGQLSQFFKQLGQMSSNQIKGIANYSQTLLPVLAACVPALFTGVVEKINKNRKSKRNAEKIERRYGDVNDRDNPYI